MPDNLARFERLASQAAERRRRGEDSESKAEDGWRSTEIAEEEQRSLLSAEYRAGPPADCHVCYSWRRHVKFGGYSWTHGAPINPAVRDFALWDDGNPEPCTFCTHACHGTEGYPLPVIALAAG